MAVVEGQKWHMRLFLFKLGKKISIANENNFILQVTYVIYWEQFMKALWFLEGKKYRIYIYSI